MSVGGTTGAGSTASTDPFAGYKTLGGGAGTATGTPSSWFSTKQSPTDQSGLAPQPVNGANDSLTSFFRSLTNLTGQTGVNQVNQGAATVGQGLSTVGTGLGDQATGMQTLQAPIDFYTKLLSGDPAAMTAALAPTANIISQQYEGAKSATGEGLPSGGFRSTAMAGLPFAQAGKVGDAALGLQSTAATQLGTLGGQQASIGQGISNTGLGVAGVGSTQQSQGLTALMGTITDLLAKMGINLQGAGVNSFATFSQGLNALI